MTTNLFVPRLRAHKLSAAVGSGKTRAAVSWIASRSHHAWHEPARHGRRAQRSRRQDSSRRGMDPGAAPARARPDRAPQDSQEARQGRASVRCHARGPRGELAWLGSSDTPGHFCGEHSGSFTVTNRSPHGEEREVLEGNGHAGQQGPAAEVVISGGEAAGWVCVDASGRHEEGEGQEEGQEEGCEEEGGEEEGREELTDGPSPGALFDIAPRYRYRCRCAHAASRAHSLSSQLTSSVQLLSSTNSQPGVSAYRSRWFHLRGPYRPSREKQVRHHLASPSHTPRRRGPYGAHRLPCCVPPLSPMCSGTDVSSITSLSVFLLREGCLKREPQRSPSEGDTLGIEGPPGVGAPWGSSRHPGHFCGENAGLHDAHAKAPTLSGQDSLPRQSMGHLAVPVTRRTGHQLLQPTQGSSGLVARASKASGEERPTVGRTSHLLRAPRW